MFGNLYSYYLISVASAFQELLGLMTANTYATLMSTVQTMELVSTCILTHCGLQRAPTNQGPWIVTMDSVDQA